VKRFPRYATKRAAVEAWMDRDFSFVKQDTIPTEDWYDRVTVLGAATRTCPNCGEEFDREEFEAVEHPTDEYIDQVRCPNDPDEVFEASELTLFRDPPMWGTLFVADDSAMESILRSRAQELAEKANVRVCEDDAVGVFICVDGAGYNFYDEHWIPLYEAIGFEGYKQEVSGADGLRILADLAEHWIDDESHAPVHPGSVIGSSNEPLRERVRNALANVYSVEEEDDGGEAETG